MRFPPSRNSFAYPSRPPALNTRGIKNIRLACVAHGAGASMRDLVSGYIALPQSNTRFESNILGPTCWPTGTANLAYLSFPNPIPTELFTQFTMAVIWVNYGTTTSGQGIIGDNTGGPTCKITIQGASQAAPTVIFSVSGVGTSSAPYVIGNPNFTIVSAWRPAIPSPNCRLVTLDLITGQVSIGTGTGVANGAGVAGGANYNVLTYGPGASAVNPSRLACGMIAQSYLTLNQMLEWTIDPWSLWYAPTYRGIRSVPQAPPPPLAIDGAVSFKSNSPPVNGTLTTTNAGDIIVICVFAENYNATYPSITGVTVGGSAATLRNKFQWQGNMAFGAGGGTYANIGNDVEIWWFYAASALSSAAISVAGSFNDSSIIYAFGVSGWVGTAYQTNPWDQSAATAAAFFAAQPTATSTHTPILSASNISTTNASTFIFSFITDDLFDVYNGSPGALAGTTATATSAGNQYNSDNCSISASVQYRILSSPISSASAAFNAAGGGTGGWSILTDALAQSGTAPPPVVTPNAPAIMIGA